MKPEAHTSLTINVIAVILGLLLAFGFRACINAMASTAALQGQEIEIPEPGENSIEVKVEIPDPLAARERPLSEDETKKHGQVWELARKLAEEIRAVCAKECSPTGQWIIHVKLQEEQASVTRSNRKNKYFKPQTFLFPLPADKNMLGLLVKEIADAVLPGVLRGLPQKPSKPLPPKKQEKKDDSVAEVA